MSFISLGQCAHTSHGARRKRLSRQEQLGTTTEELERHRASLANLLPAAQEDHLHQVGDEMDRDKLTQKAEAEKEIERLDVLLGYLKSPVYFRDQIREREGDASLDHLAVRPALAACNAQNVKH
jgi:hypothetical protein